MKPQRLADIDARRFTERRQALSAEVDVAVRDIFSLVREDGDTAVRRLTKRFDGADLAQPFLDKASWEAAADMCPSDVKKAIRGNLTRIRMFHEAQRGEETVMDVAAGLRLGRRPVAYRSAACYVPGGRASYPSTVLMTVTPAVIAGVERIIVVTPPKADGSIDPAVAYAARAAGATDILRCGGAQAIAALAFGTELVPQVQVIVGPGNAYVTAAKEMATKWVVTDAPAGPSELLIVADDGANASFVALDLVAQAEHDPDAQVLLVTTSASLADEVAAHVEALTAAAPRKDIIQASLRDHGAILIADDLETAIAFADDYAPEHLTLQLKEPHAALARIHNAGSVFLGPHTPVSLGDYGSGTNHVLPTMGLARLHGGLSVDRFRRWMTWQEATESGLGGVASDIMTLADAEGLHGHSDAVRRRLT